jgi:hypothetical protein
MDSRRRVRFTGGWSVEHFGVVLGGFGKMTAWRVDMLRTRLRLRHTDVNFSRTRDHVQSYLYSVCVVQKVEKAFQELQNRNVLSVIGQGHWEPMTTYQRPRSDFTFSKSCV